MSARHWSLSLVVAALGAMFFPGLAGAQWTPNGNAMCTGANDQLSPGSCADGRGGAFITWADSRSGPYTLDIYAQRVNAFGQPEWTANGVPICTIAGNQLFPVIVRDGAGGAIIAWADRRGTANDIYAQRIDASGAVQWTVDGVAVCAATDDQFYPKIVSDGLGGVIVSWEDYRSGISGDIYAQRVNAAGAPAWTVDGMDLCITVDDQIAPDIAPDGVNGAIVTWVDSRGDDFDVYAQRVGSAGTALWTANGVAVCAALGSQEEPAVIADGAGGVIVTWHDSRANNFSSDVYVQRINAAGAPQWLLDGVALSTAFGDQSFPLIVSDGLGGAIVAWEDSRAGQTDVYAQRVNSAGVTRWATDGLGLGILIGSQQNPAIAPAPNGGAIVVWEDLRASTFYADIYAQRVDSAGVAQWAPNGLAISIAGGDQASPAIALDNAGGAIIAWEDGRGGLASDIYAQRVTAAGVAGPTLGVGDPVALDFRMLPPHPNPSRAGTVLSFVLPATQRVTADLFDIDGRKVRTLADDELFAAGACALTWDGRDRAGSLVGAGIYLARVRTENGSGVAKMTVLR